MKWLFAAIFAGMMSSAAQAQTPPPQQKVDDLVRLLQDPEVRTWLEAQKPAVPDEANEIASDLMKWEADTRSRVDGIVEAIPRIPSELAAAATRTRHEAAAQGYAPVLVALAGLLAMGLGGQFLFARSTPRRANVLRRLANLAVFGGVMAVIFFAVGWPPLARAVLLVGLIATLAYRAASATADVTARRSALRRRIKLFSVAVVLAVALAALGGPLSVDPVVSAAISYCFSILLALLAIESVWSVTERTPLTKIAVSIFIVALWVVWCLGLTGLFWLGVYALVLPGLLRTVQGAAMKAVPSERNSLRRVLVIRGSRAVMVLAAVAWIALAWRLGPNSLTHLDPMVAAIAYGLLKSVVVLLIADLIWHLALSWIDRTLAAVPASAVLAPADAARRGRIDTLLPVFRNALAVIVAVMALLIVLSELGVEIGPLIAGAGIFGVAIGFGSQTLVKDVISGVFYMLDDAFRVGEYIQAKTYKGTVEGFSLRSVRLRHHRGPVFTIPFGELGAVENMSRDWVIDKFRISVAYDTDIDVAWKIAKRIGAELQADPDVGPLFLEPLKMKGVEEFGDYGIALGFAMTTLPGQQTYIRRKAYAMIREAFKKSGIEFATPSVQVGNNNDRNAAAVASSTMTGLHKTPQATE